MATTLVIKNADFSVNKLATVTFGDNVPCTALSLSDATKNLSAIGGTYPLIATPTPANTTDVISWGSSDSNIVSVANGVITAVAIGEATITATCGNCTATCEVTVEVVPDYVVSGAFNARKATGGVLNGSVTTQAAESKYGIIAKNSDSEGIKTVDRNGGSQAELDSNFRFVPIPIPNGAKRIKLDSKFTSGQTTIGFRTRFLWFDSTQSESGYVGAKCLDGKSGENNWDQDTAVTTITVDIPDNLTGLDSFACSLYFSDYAAQYNVDYTDKMDVTFLPAAEE